MTNMPCECFSFYTQQLPRARNTQQQAVKFHNSTFFPSYKPRVYMEENNEKSDDLADISVG